MIFSAKITRLCRFYLAASQQNICSKLVIEKQKKLRSSEINNLF